MNFTLSSLYKVYIINYDTYTGVVIFFRVPHTRCCHFMACLRPVHGSVQVFRRTRIIVQQLAAEEVGHCLFRGGGTLSVQRRWDIVCSEEVGHCLFRGGGTLSVQRRWDIVCSEEVGHCLFRGGGTLSVHLRNHTSSTASHQCSAISCWSVLGRLQFVAG